MKNKVVVITGGSSGLGKELARSFMARKYVVIISSENPEQLEKVATGLGIDSFKADVTSDKDMFALQDYIKNKYQKADIWINNAGVWMPKMHLEEINIEQAKHLFDVNVFGTVNGSISALKCFDGHPGTIINVISTSALEPRPLQCIYSSSKHALKGFTDSLREELREKGIKVIGIYPGGIKTELFGNSKPEDYDKFLEPSEVAEKLAINLEQEKPEDELIIRRLGQ